MLAPLGRDYCQYDLGTDTGFYNFRDFYEFRTCLYWGTAISLINDHDAFLYCYMCCLNNKHNYPVLIG